MTLPFMSKCSKAGLNLLNTGGRWNAATSGEADMGHSAGNGYEWRGRQSEKSLEHLSESLGPSLAGPCRLTPGPSCLLPPARPPP